jgi:hypothetical protein
MPNINDYKSNALKGGGVRQNLFRVQTADKVDTNLAGFLIKSASLPAATVGEITVPYRGRVIKLPGDRTFEDWEITVISDSDMQLRSEFEKWHNELNNHLENKVDYEDSLFQDWSVTQLDRAGEKIREYNLIGCWPKNLGAMEVAFDTNDTLAEFTVSLSYQYWTSEEIS